MIRRNYTLEIKAASEMTNSYATGRFVLSYMPLVLLIFTAYPHILSHCVNCRQYSLTFVREM